MIGLFNQRLPRGTFIPLSQAKTSKWIWPTNSVSLGEFVWHFEKKIKLLRIKKIKTAGVNNVRYDAVFLEGWGLLCWLAETNSNNYLVYSSDSNCYKKMSKKCNSPGKFQGLAVLLAVFFRKFDKKSQNVTVTTGYYIDAIFRTVQILTHKRLFCTTSFISF